MGNGVRFVVVGYGMGECHAELIAKTEGLALHGVCDLDPGKLARAAGKFPGIATYGDYRQALDDPRVDAVAIVTPHRVHERMAVAAMDRGKHVITDKAMCLTVEEAHSMLAARDRNKVLFSVFHNRRWDGDFLTVSAILAKGLIGRLYHVQTTVTGSLLWGGWRTKREESGGWLYDWGAHMIDQVLIITGAKAVSVHAFLHHRFRDPCSVEDYINATVRFDTGITATLVVGNINRLLMPRWYVMGETGTLQCEGFDTPVKVRAEADGLEGDTTFPLLKGDWRSFYQNIAEVFGKKADLAVRPEQMVPQIAIAQAAYRSIGTGEVVRL